MRRWVVLLAGFTVACSGQGSSSGGPVINKPYAKAPLPETTSDSLRACFDNPATQAYMKKLHRQIIERWNVPYGTGAYDVAATVTLETSGAVTAFRVSEKASAAQADAISEAVNAAQPFPPLTGGGVCLSGVPIHMRFRTPSQE
jgi:hypothetical protein